uniref:Protein kinase domain-containing protein n=1 Tax=Physcomitrium patens TaxID=3218 RepID=A0A7I4F4R3_PHYPA
MKSLTISKCIKKGSCGEVYKLKWLGLVCATKKIDVELDKMFIKEVSILRSLSHPNLIIYYFAMKGLKPENILVDIVETMVMNKITQHAIVKVIDFGMSKIEVGRNPKAIEKNYIYGSLNYMAPKAMRNKFQIMAICHFKADVYSFAMICSKILSKKDPFHDICDMKEILERIEKGERPNLPSNCDDLIELIQECWRLNPLHRPKFANICERLKLLKKKYLVGIGIANAPKFEAAKNNYHQNIEFQQIHIGLPFVDIFEEEIFGRAQYLLQIKEQCAIKVKALYLVGIGGIDKTTIAKAILTSLKDIYNASCFVECIESGGDCYTTSCNILEQFKVKSKPKDVKEAQKMLKSFLEENKTILVFDNNQIEDVVPMDDIFASNGSTLIATIQNSKAIRHYGKEVCKINIEELDEGASMKLFITYSCGHENFSNELNEIAIKIVRACNGLPLSLKVIGAFLRENKRLRCWKRVLQKLRKGRELDGDENNSNYKIWKILRVNFDNLKVKEKNMFLDICCFFYKDICPQGMSKERALEIWTNSQKNIFEQDVEFMLDILINQSLVKVDKDGIIRIHDQLQDMDKSIVKKEMEYKYTSI